MSLRKNKLNDTISLEESEVLELTDFDTAFQKFIEDCRIRNLKNDTIIFYQRVLKLYEWLLEDQKIDPTPCMVTKDIVNKNIILYMLDVKKCQEVTVNTRLRAVRTFYNFLEREGLIRYNPFHEIKMIVKSIAPLLNIQRLF